MPRAEEGAPKGARWWKQLLAVIVAVLAIGLALEFALRFFIPSVIAGQVREAVGLSADHEVEVDLGGSALLHAMRGEVGDVEIRVDRVPLLESITGDVRLRAVSVPFDPTSGEISGGRARLTIPAEDIGPVVSVLTQGIADSGRVRGDTIEIGRTVAVFGQEVPLTAALRVAVKDGDVVVDPAGVRAVGLDLEAEQLRQTTGGLLDPVLTAQTICVRDQLPAGIELNDIELSSTGSVSVDADLAPGILSDASQQRKGSCG